MSTLHRFAVLVALGLLAWVLVLMTTAPVRERLTPMTVAPAVTYQEDADG